MRYATGLGRRRRRDTACELGRGRIVHELRRAGGARFRWRTPSRCGEVLVCDGCAEARREYVEERLLLAWSRAVGRETPALLVTAKFRGRDRRESWPLWCKRVRFTAPSVLELPVQEVESEEDTASRGRAVFRWLRRLELEARGLLNNDGDTVPQRKRRCRCSERKQWKGRPPCDCRCECALWCVSKDKAAVGRVSIQGWRAPCGCVHCGYAQNLLTWTRAHMPASWWVWLAAELKRRLWQDVKGRWAVDDGPEPVYIGSTEWTEAGLPHLHAGVSMNLRGVSADDPASIERFTDWIKRRWVRLVPDTTLAQGLDVQPPQDAVDVVDYLVKYVTKATKMPRAFQEIPRLRLWWKSNNLDVPVKAALGSWTTRSGRRLVPQEWVSRRGRRYYHRRKREKELGPALTAGLVGLGLEGVEKPTFVPGRTWPLEQDALDVGWSFFGMPDEGLRRMILEDYLDYSDAREERMLRGRYRTDRQLDDEEERRAGSGARR